MKIQNKKALVSRTVVLTIILILSIAIIFFLWYQFNWTGTVNSETCHTSVILKKTVIETPGVGGKMVNVPLRCQTEKICIKTGYYDDCEEFKGLKDVKEEKVSSTTEIVKIIADSMVNCWAMMGEGRDNMVFSKELYPILSPNKKGAICSRIAFSQKIKEDKENYPQITASELADVFNNEKIDTGGATVSYAQFLSGVYDGKTPLSEDKEYAIVYFEILPTKFNKELASFSGMVLGAASLSFLGIPGVVIGAIGGFIGGAKIGTAGENLAEQKDYWSLLQLISYDIT